MPDMWERARVRHESTPVPEELEFAVASALRAGQRRLRGSFKGMLARILAFTKCSTWRISSSVTFWK